MNAPLGVIITSSLSQNVKAISSLTMLMVDGGSPPALWSINGVGVWVLCCLLAQGFGFCGVLMLALGGSYSWSSFSNLLGGPKSARPTHLWGGGVVLRSHRGKGKFG
jgi:hypothetical protein